MLTLQVQVPEARERTAIATLRDGLKTIATDHAVASATPAIAAQRGNPGCDPLRLWGHPPLGSYRMLRHLPTEPDRAGEYGGHLLLFEPESGVALDAESFGRLALLVYGGPAGSDGRMRRTQGGLRLTNTMLDTIVERLQASEDMTLQLVPLRAPSWWQFWRKHAETQPLSGNMLKPLLPPVDEASILEELLRNAVRRGRRALRDSREDTRDTKHRDDSRTSSVGSERDEFRGKGGESGGGGAGGGWDSAAGGARGVDQAGRIIGGVAAGATLAALAGETPGASAPQGTDGSSAGSNDADSPSSTDTTTGTSY